MKLKTERFGEIDIPEKNIIKFNKGLPAFENLQKFALLDVKESPAFKWLQSINDTKIVFLLVDPFLVKKDYFIDINEALQEELRIEKKEDVLVYTTVTVPEGGFKKATTNLLGPIVINRQKRLGKQIVLERDDLSIKYPLFPNNNKKMAKCGG